MGLQLQALLGTCLWSHAAGHSLKYISQRCVGQPAACQEHSLHAAGHGLQYIHLKIQAARTVVACQSKPAQNFSATQHGFEDVV